MRSTLLQALLVAAVGLLLASGGCSDAPQQQPATSTPPSQPAVSAQPTASSQQSQGFQSLSPQQASQLIAQTPNLLIVDVRTPRELKQDGLIKGSVNLPFWAVLRGQHNLPKDRPLLVVCAVGGRSYAAGQVLVRQQGYRQVYNLSGGISAWKKAGLPVVYPQ